jgi:hypothetical protein
LSLSSQVWGTQPIFGAIFGAMDSTAAHSEAFSLLHQPHRTLPDLGWKLVCLVHGAFFSKVGASSTYRRFMVKDGCRGLINRVQAATGAQQRLTKR